MAVCAHDMAGFVERVWEHPGHKGASIDSAQEGVSLNRRLDWVPDHHLEVAATLAHADEVIATAAEMLFEYQRQPDGIIHLKEVPVVTYSETVVTGISPIPKRVPLLVADALVSLRNAIEHTIFSEIEHRDGMLDEQAARVVDMPAATTYDDFEEWIKRKRRNGPPSLQRGSELLRRIEGLQPYQRIKNPEQHPMALLASHTNHSKHRAPSITAVRLAAIHREDPSPPSLADVQRLPEAPLRVGDVIARTPRGVRIPVALFPTIGINRPGTTQWPVLMTELEYLATWVRTQAVPRLITGSEPSTSRLPATYDIAAGHADERAAVELGSATSATQRHKERLGAASVRQNLVETLAMLEDAPVDADISAWLESLTDLEVLSRMDRLQMTTDYDPEIVFSNKTVLDEMCADARRFAAER